MIEKGTHLRIKLIGTRSDVGSMFAIGSVKEDFLGFGILIPLLTLLRVDYRLGPSNELASRVFVVLAIEATSC